MWFATQKNIVIISLFDIILFGNVRKMWRRQFMFFYSRILIQRFLHVSRSKVASTRTTWYRIPKRVIYSHSFLFVLAVNRITRCQHAA